MLHTTKNKYTFEHCGFIVLMHCNTLFFASSFFVDRASVGERCLRSSSDHQHCWSGSRNAARCVHHYGHWSIGGSTHPKWVGICTQCESDEFSGEQLGPYERNSVSGSGKPVILSYDHLYLSACLFVAKHRVVDCLLWCRFADFTDTEGFTVIWFCANFWYFLSGKGAH